MDAKEFWNVRIYNKNQHRNVLIDLREILETETFSVEEKIYLRQAIDWLEYLEKRHPVNDEKFKYDGLRIKVQDASSRRIHQVILEKLQDEDESETELDS